MGRVHCTLLILHLSARGIAFDFDEEEEEAPSTVQPTFFADEAASTVPILHQIGANGFVNRSKLFYTEGSRYVASTTGGIANARTSQAKLSGDELDAFQVARTPHGLLHRVCQPSQSPTHSYPYHSIHQQGVGLGGSGCGMGGSVCGV